MSYLARHYRASIQHTTEQASWTDFEVCVSAVNVHVHSTRANGTKLLCSTYSEASTTLLTSTLVEEAKILPDETLYWISQLEFGQSQVCHLKQVVWV